MRRNLDHKERLYILKSNYIGYLSYVQGEMPFIAPITYFFDEDRNVIIGYSGEGHKISSMRKKPMVSMCVTDIDSINNWQSILVHGTYEELEGSEAKSYLHDFSLGVKHLIQENEQQTMDFISQFSSKISQDDIPIVFLIKIDEITGKLRMT